MKKNFRIFFAVLLFLFGVGCYLLAENIAFNKKIEISADFVEFIGWEETQYGFVSEDDPQLIFPSTGYIGNIKYLNIECSIMGELNPKIFYGGSFIEQFSEKKSYYPNYSYDKGILKINVNKWSPFLRLDLTEDTAIILSNIRSIDYEYGLKVDILVLLYIATFMLAVSAFLIYSPGKVRNLRKSLSIFGKYTYLLSNLVKKDITTKYRRSILGILWSVLNPLLMMLVITAVFKNIFRMQVENFPVYYLTGSLIFNFMADATTSSMASILGAGGLIKKVYIPKYIFPLEKCLFALINTTFSFAAVIIIIPILGAQFKWTLLLFWVPLLFVLLFSAGLSLVLSALNVFFRDTNHLYGVWITAWLYLTPIIYPQNILPRTVRSVMKFNPMYHYIDYFRQLVIYGEIPGLRPTLICIAFSLGFLVLGLVVFKKMQDKFILYI